MPFRLSLLVPIVFLLGCEEAPPANLKPVAEKPAAAAEATVQIASWDEAQKLVAAQKGKVVVLDLWSTACLPCLKEFPNLVALHKRFPGKLACMSFNLDYTGDPKEPPQTVREPVLAFVRKQGATFTHVVSSDPDTAVYEKLDLAAIPAVLVFGRDGRLLKRFDNDKEEFGKDGYTYKDHVVPFVEKLLAE